jgi:hypothetical protein
MAARGVRAAPLSARDTAKHTGSGCGRTAGCERFLSGCASGRIGVQARQRPDLGGDRRRCREELSTVGYRTPRAMRAASWQDRVDALGRGHYRRYDERTATMLGDGASLVSERWRGDLRRLRASPGWQPRWSGHRGTTTPHGTHSTGRTARDAQAAVSGSG